MLYGAAVSTAALPEGFLAIPVGARESVCAAVRALQSEGGAITNKTVRAELKRAGNTCSTGWLAALVRWQKQGLLPERWDHDPDNPGAPNPAKGGPRAGRPEEPSEPEDVDEKSERAELARLIEALTDGGEAELLALNRQVQRLLALGLMTASEAGTHKQLMQERRMALDAERKAPTDDPERVFPVDAEGALVLEGFRRICSEARRSEVLAFVAEKLAEDLAELPAVDPLGAL